MPYRDPEKRKACVKAYHDAHKEDIIRHKRKYADANVEKVREAKRRYSRKNKEHIKNYNITHAIQIKQRFKERTFELWEEARDFFGPCECCGESRIEFLSIDHRNGGGTQKRKNGEPCGRTLLARFKRVGWPIELKSEYRLLCYNCNQSIGFLGYCPHQVERDEAAKSESKTKGLPS